MTTRDMYAALDDPEVQERARNILAFIEHRHNQRTVPIPHGITLTEIGTALNLTEPVVAEACAVLRYEKKLAKIASNRYDLTPPPLEKLEQAVQAAGIPASLLRGMVQQPKVGVGLVLIDSHSETLLLVKKGPSSRHAGKYVLPGGVVLWQETTATAVRREVEEETGITPDCYEFDATNADVFTYIDSERNTHQIILVFIGSLVMPYQEMHDPSAFIPNDEIEAIGWFDTSKLISLLETGQLDPLTIRILLHGGCFTHGSGNERNHFLAR